MPHRGLTERGIAERALALVDGEGVDAFSMRKLAAACGSSAMALYHHYSDKDAVLEAVVQLLLAEVEAPGEAASWKDALRVIMRSVRRVGLAHPNAAPLIARFPPRTPDALAFVEAGFRACLRSGFTPEMTARSYRALAAYSLGTFDIELGGYFGAPRDAGKPEALAVLSFDRHLPNVSEISPLLLEQDAEAEFEFGLELILVALAAAKTAAG
ncbi:TetR/AcrR family transcriptional regulator [Microbispora sp. NBC_01189]|uniref:TetR/AcrR family transcriptional regulator n=1 Tax=Microbispora sp. NBC_01189 TaxID=2903583 RepID=UPI002E15BD87|nr:TetR/AcrR family transcriptional regulator [Microbispora sp. NBC_01189]